MPNEHGEYTTAEKARYRPGPCPHCGRATKVMWTNDPGLNERQHPWLPTRRCPDGECPGNRGLDG